jgi:hypothetical protein
VTLHRVDTVLAESAASLHQRDSLSHVAVQSQRQALKFQGEAHRLRRVADSLRNVVVDTVIVPPLGTIVPPLAYDTLSLAYTTLDDAYGQAMVANQSLRAEVFIAETRIQSLERTLGEARGALAKTRTPSRWGLGCAGGYSVAMAGGVAHAGPGLACGVTLRLR